MTTFLKIYNNIHLQLEVEPGWEDKSGSYDGLAERDIGLEPGTRFRAVDRYGRKLICITTPVGNLVFFQLFTGGGGDEIGRSVPQALMGLIPAGLEIEQQLLFVGLREHDCNLGEVLERIGAHY